MKIVHIAPNSPYNDYWGYQDNLLPKYQRKLGHEVVMITTTKMHQDGKLVEIEPTNYVLNDGVKVYRCNYKQYPIATITGVCCFIPVYDLLEDIKPDFIFYHGLVSTTILDVIKYKKEHEECVIVEDNHMDYNIGNKFKTPKEKMIRAWLRLLNRKTIKYVDKVYGVTPWRKTYAEDYFGIPADKTDVLIMGADDEKIRLSERESIRKIIRSKYNVAESDFLIVSGGKIDKKKGIHLLAEACVQMKGNIKLLIFGQIADELKEQMENLISSNDKIIYIGWIDSDKVYDYFFAADLVAFPGQHSVLWEQACASKVPCLFERWEGMEHVNNGGNSEFVFPIDVSTLTRTISELLYTDKYYRMLRIAQSAKTDVYRYSKIAEKSLECAGKYVGE
jgi:1,2-diacylglycerol 3-alpha-glucosyltransferase